MDINNDLQQINTFVKGMNTDVSDALMDSSQYRYAENVRLTTNTDENTGELRLIEGNALYSDVSDYGSIIAMTSVRDLLIIITKLSVANGEIKPGNYILVGDTNDKEQGWRVAYWSGNGGELFGDKLSLVTRWENDKDIKLYIADGIHGLLYINLYSGQAMKQGIDSIKSNVNVTLFPITAELSTSGGTLPPVKVQYAYRLYKQGGASTSLSPLSNIVTLYDGIKGYSNTIKNTSKAVTVTIANQASIVLNYLQIYRISYQQIGQAPTVHLIYDGKFKKTHTDTGVNVEETAFEDFLAMFYQNITPRVIESKEDHLFAANMRYEMDDVDKKIASLDFRIRSTGDYNNNGTKRAYNIQFDDISNYNRQYWLKNTGSNIIGGTGEYISWEENIQYRYCTIDNKKYKTYNIGSPSNQIYEPLNSLKQGEVYRYGAIFYDKTGGKSSVKWLCDIMARPLSGDEGFVTYGQGSGIVTKVPQIGIKFTVNKLPTGFSGVEIVRCPRGTSDRITQVQGIAGFPYKIYGKIGDGTTFQDRNTICAPYVLSMNKFSFISEYSQESVWNPVNAQRKNKSESDNTKLVIASPEFSYQPDDIENILGGLEENLSIRVVRKLYENTEKYYNNINSDHIHEDNKLVKISEHSGYWQLIASPGVYAWQYNPHSGSASILDNWDGQTSPYIKDYRVPNISEYVIYYKVSDTSQDQNWSNIQRDTYKIENIAFTNPYSEKPKFYSQFLTSNKMPNYRNSSVNLGTLQYINWSVPLMYDIQDSEVALFYEKDDNGNWFTDATITREMAPLLQPSGSTGSYILADLGVKPIQFIDVNTQRDIDLDVYLQTYIVNIRNENAIPYGGQYTVEDSEYMSYGSYIAGTGTIDVFDGDCYPGIFEFNVQHAWFDPKIITPELNMYNGIRQASVCYAAIESDIDLSATYGDLYSRLPNNSYYFQDEEVQITTSNGTFTQSKPAYLYNTGYGAEPDAIQYSSIYYSEVSDAKYDSRVYYSKTKTNGESIDSWLQFSPNNFLDVDSRFGQITNMKLFKDKLLFWQEHATGILSVNERTVLNDLEKNDIVVGSGGTLSRYDYISTVYGMKPEQYEAEAQTNTAQYWWDGYNKEILVYSGGMELVPLTKLKGLTNYMNQRTESDHPVLAFDSKYDELLAKVVDTKNGEESLVYNEQIQSFQSVYTFNPQYRSTIGNNLYLAGKNKCIYLQNNQRYNNLAYLFDNPALPKVRIVVNKNNIYNKTFDNITFGGRMYKGSTVAALNYNIGNTDGKYIKNKEHVGESPMHHLQFTFDTPLKQHSSVCGDDAVSVNEYDFRLAVPRNGQDAISQVKGVDLYNTKPLFNTAVDYGNRMKGKTMQCEIASDYNSTDFSLQYITTKFRMSWS